MTARTEIKLNLTEMDAIVKVQCLRTECVNNLVMTHFSDNWYCNIKYIQIDENGQCANFAERRNTNADSE